jgi:hypothetical protein
MVEDLMYGKDGEELMEDQKLRKEVKEGGRGRATGK